MTPSLPPVADRDPFDRRPIDGVASSHPRQSAAPLAPVSLEPGADPLKGFNPEHPDSPSDPLDRFNPEPLVPGSAWRARFDGVQTEPRGQLMDADERSDDVPVTDRFERPPPSLSRPDGSQEDSHLPRRRMAVLTALSLVAAVLVVMVVAFVRGRVEIAAVSRPITNPPSLASARTLGDLPAAAATGGDVAAVRPPLKSPADKSMSADAAGGIAIAAPAGTTGFEKTDPVKPAAGDGQFEGRTEPDAMRVLADGSVAGATPLVPRGIAVGQPAVVMSHDAAAINRTVDVTAGSTARLLPVVAGRAGARAGWFSVESPVGIRIVEDGRTIWQSTGGQSKDPPVALAEGPHQLELLNDEIEFRIPVSVQIEAGKTARLSVPRPTGTLSFTALPWAEVFLDGRSLGRTPIASVQVPVGRHDIVWRHPELGEKRSMVVVGAQTPARANMEFSP